MLMEQPGPPRRANVVDGPPRWADAVGLAESANRRRTQDLLARRRTRKSKVRPLWVALCSPDRHRSTVPIEGDTQVIFLPFTFLLYQQARLSRRRSSPFRIPRWHQGLSIHNHGANQRNRRREGITRRADDARCLDCTYLPVLNFFAHMVKEQSVCGVILEFISSGKRGKADALCREKQRRARKSYPVMYIVPLDLQVRFQRKSTRREGKDDKVRRGWEIETMDDFCSTTSGDLELQGDYYRASRLDSRY
jgi:hypothetical protein